MPDQKLDNQLNLALDTPMEEREKSVDLNVGFSQAEGVWDVIVKYSGDTKALAGEGTGMVPLLGNYAIVTIPQEKLQEFSRRPQVEFVEKPKRLFFAVNQGKTASCIREVQRGSGNTENVGDVSNIDNAGNTKEDVGNMMTNSLNLTGKGILVGIVDSGVDVSHPDFRNVDGTTRILRYWDQSGAGMPPEGYLLGTEYTNVEINEYLGVLSGENVEKNGSIIAEFEGSVVENVEIGEKVAQNVRKREKVVENGRDVEGMEIPGQDYSGHGTAVLGIAAGNGRASNGRYRGIAYESEIIAVKLGVPRENSFPRTTELMQGVDYLVRQAMKFGRPMVINLSFGNNYGSHRGDSLIETYLDTVANMSRLVICVGTGNNGNGPLHTNGRLQQGETQEIELGVSSYESSLNVQLWKAYADVFDIYVEAPSGERIGPLSEALGPQRYSIGGVQLLIYYGKPGPFQLTQEIYFDFIPQANYVESGVWKFILVGESIKEGEYEMWLPGGNVLNPDTGFFLPRADGTLTIPSTARRVISVGAYDSRDDSLADFSGRGGVGVIGRSGTARNVETRNEVGNRRNIGGINGRAVQSDINNLIRGNGAGIWGMKPDLVAPGVDIMTTAPGGGYEPMTGTSFAAPFVSGSAALMMEWGDGGIIRLR